MTVEVIGVGVFRQILGKSKMPFTFQPPEGTEEQGVAVHTVLDALDDHYQGQISKELYLDNGEENLWTRVLLNGRDIRFLEKEKLFLCQGDSVFLSSVLAGG